MKPSPNNSRSAAFTFMELLCVLGIFSILACVMVLPAMSKARHRHCRINCINNIKQINLAFKQWALDNNDNYPMQVSVTNGGAMELVATGAVYAAFLVMSNELNTPKVLFCPGESDPKRIMAASFDTIRPGVANQVLFTANNNLSYFVGVEAHDSQPNMLLTGDANLTLAGKPVGAGLLVLGTNSLAGWGRPIRRDHGGGGNIGLTDGSATSCSDQGLRAWLRQSGVTTNRLALP